ncbi:MAG: hypothetical protein LBH36_03355 [Candidatus Nomurabacteria bacterium]|nr:hypothetical protein [Candidatus Nomurabacteria bacterium]
MNDLDFDELDKAIGGSGDVAPSTDDSVTAPDAAPAASAKNTTASDADTTVTDTPVEAEPAVSAEVETPSEETAEPAGLNQADLDPLKNLQAAAAEAVSSTEASESPVVDENAETVSSTTGGVEGDQGAAARSQGRFMDMVHHSSDMTVTRPSSVPPSSAQVPPSETTSREAADVSPINTDNEPTTEAHTSGSPDDELANAIGSIDFSQPEGGIETASKEATGGSEAPTEQSGDEDTPSAPINTDIAVDPVPDDFRVEDTPTPEVDGDAGDSAEASTDEEPLGSPFIPDAQVEKRPLGGAPAPVDTVESTDTNAPAPVVTDGATQSIYAPDGAPTEPPVTAKKGGGLIWLFILLGLVIVGGGGGYLAWLLLFSK